jgi:hypothetical protein
MSKTLAVVSDSYAALAFAEDRKRNPETYDLDPKKLAAQIAATTKAAQALHAKNDATCATDPAKELAKLKNQLFNLKQNCHCFETRVNESAGNVRLCEERLAKTLKTKAEQELAGNLIGARNSEHAIQRLEGELDDARTQLLTNQHYNSASVRALRVFQTEIGPRIKELEAEIAKAAKAVGK